MVSIAERESTKWASAGKASFRMADENGNQYKTYVDVLADFTKEGFMRPIRITWEDGREYAIDRVLSCCRAASRKAGGCGIRYTCMVSGREIELFYEENYRWFLCRKKPARSETS